MADEKCSSNQKLGWEMEWTSGTGRIEISSYPLSLFCVGLIFRFDYVIFQITEHPRAHHKVSFLA